MQKSNLSIAFVTFVIIWTVWFVWSGLNPSLGSAQLALLFAILPISLLLIAFSFTDSGKDDDNGDGGTLEPIY